LWSTLVLKKTFGLDLDLSLPWVDLNWMRAVPLGDWVDGFHPTKRLHTHHGLELRRMNSSLFDSVIDHPFD
jgi:hypothetical protein